jgi:thiol-disulfide isomerase/thioredoxin
MPSAIRSYIIKDIAYIFLLLILFSCKNRIPTFKTGFEGKFLPPITFRLMDSNTLLNTNKIPNDKPIVFFYFSPDCPYCRAQTQDIIDNIKSLSNIRFYMISNFPLKILRDYEDKYELNKYVCLAQDYKGYFNSYYNISSVPYIAIYNTNRKLKQILIGKIKIDWIKDIALK